MAVEGEEKLPFSLEYDLKDINKYNLMFDDEKKMSKAYAKNVEGLENVTV